MDNSKFDSNEEMYVFWWLKELQDQGYIKEIQLHPESFKLCDGLVAHEFIPYKRKEGGKLKEEPLLQPKVYTTDFKVIWDKSALGIFATPLDSHQKKKHGMAITTIICQKTLFKEVEFGNDIRVSMADMDGDYYSYIEVKPSFDQHNMTMLARVNITWTWEKFHQFVNMVIPDKHFDRTFTPERYFYTNKSQKPRKLKYKNVRTIEQFIADKTQF